MRGWARPSAGRIGGTVCVGLSAWLLVSAPAASDELVALTAQALPLAIRDGRIAELTVHIVPFEILADKPSAVTAAALDRLIATVATDCFLTAQAIGHVRPGIPGDGETLAAHRLARARSEAVQAALIRGGLPAASVASVWDYQFTLREPRVTLWVFRLPAGEECTGAPMTGAAAQVAAVELPEARAAQIAVSEPPQAPMAPVTIVARDLEPAPGIHLAPLPPTEPVVAAASGVSGPPAQQTGKAEAEPPVDPPAITTPSLPSTELSARLTVPAEPGAAVAAVAPLVRATQAPPVAEAEIVFDENSSFFPRGAETELRRLLAALRAGDGYEFEVQAAVDDKAGRKDDPAKAVAYNQWLADRRQGRVVDWLEQHAEIRVVEIRRSLLDHDPSRRVVIQARPLP